MQLVHPGCVVGRYLGLRRAGGHMELAGAERPLLRVLVVASALRPLWENAVAFFGGIGKPSGEPS